LNDDDADAPEQQRLPGQPDADTVRAIEAIVMVAVVYGMGQLIEG
jgi:hypothetical protein